MKKNGKGLRDYIERPTIGVSSVQDTTKTMQKLWHTMLLYRSNIVWFFIYFFIVFCVIM